MSLEVVPTKKMPFEKYRPFLPLEDVARISAPRAWPDQ